MAVDLAQIASPAAQDAFALRHVFETIHAKSCPTSYNFHLHTIYSDGQLPPDQILEQAIAIGLTGLAITDHHTVEGYYAAQRWLIERWEHDAWYNGAESVSLPHLWTGVEVTSKLLETDVHILGYAFDPTHPAMERYLHHCAPSQQDAQAAQVVASIHAAGGLAVLAHPVRYRRSPEDLIAAAAHLGIDGVEAFYAYDNPHPWRTSTDQTERVQHLSRTYRLLNTCGTDTHGKNILRRL